MARYQVPPDPRQGEAESPHARKVTSRPPRSSPPWLWIGLGAIVTVLAIAVAVLWARLFLEVEPVDVDPTPTVTFQTVVPTTPAPTPTVDSSMPASEPTATLAPDQPAPTEESPPAPAGVVAKGARVLVTGTGPTGLSVRAGPGTDYARLEIRSDGETLEVLDGPEEAGDYVWWFIRTQDGTEGWVAEDFLEAQ